MLSASSSRPRPNAKPTCRNQQTGIDDRVGTEHPAQVGRGTGVRVRIGAIDLLTLDVAASVTARLDAVPSGADDAAAAGDDDDGESAGPLAIAIDVVPEEAGVEPDPVAAAPA